MDPFVPSIRRRPGVLDELGFSRSPADLIEAVKAGVRIRAFRALAEALGVSETALADAVGISGAQLTRRKRAGTFAAAESERVLRLAWLLHVAAEVFGTVDRAAAWLKAPNRALGGAAPLAYAETEIGAREVESVLGRIDFGVYT